jgi:hypothetical protein
MKIRLLLLAALAAAPATVQAQSNTDEAKVSIEGNVASLCVLGAPSQSSIDLGSLAATSGTRVGKLATLTTQQVTLPGSFCNFAGTALTVSADALVAADDSATQDGFARAVNYTSTVSNWATSAATVTTTATAAGATPSAQASGGTQSAPKLTDLTLSLSSFSVPSDRLLVAGGYTGSVTITLGPSVTEK